MRRRVQDRFDLRFPSAAALPTSQRFILIFYPGSAKRSGERGKRRAVHSTTTPKAVPTPPNAGKHPLCSPRLKRTPVPASRFPPHRHQRPPSLSKPDRQGGIWTQKRFSFGPGAARFLWQDQRKWGAPSPQKEVSHGTAHLRRHRSEQSGQAPSGQRAHAPEHLRPGRAVQL